MSMNAVFPGGRLQQKVISVTLVNNTLKTVDTVVDQNQRWILLNVKVVNCDDVQRTVTVRKFKEVAKTNLIAVLATGAIPTVTMLNWPNTITGSLYTNSHPQLVILETANVISVEWAAGGASGGGTDADGLVIEYLEIDL